LANIKPGFIHYRERKKSVARVFRPSIRLAGLKTYSTVLVTYPEVAENAEMNIVQYAYKISLRIDG